MKIFILLSPLILLLCDAAKRVLEDDSPKPSKRARIEPIHEQTVPINSEHPHDEVIDAFRALGFHGKRPRESSDEQPRKKMRTQAPPSPPATPPEVPSTPEEEESSEVESLDQTAPVTSVPDEDSGEMEDEDTDDSIPAAQLKRSRSEEAPDERPKKKLRTQPPTTENRSDSPMGPKLKRRKGDEDATANKRFKDEVGNHGRFEFDRGEQEEEDAAVDMYLRSDENRQWQSKHGLFSQFRKAVAAMTGRWPPFTFKNAYYFEASPIFNQKHLTYLDPSTLTLTNSQNILRTMCYLDPNNPFMKISQSDLLNQAAADPQLTAELILRMFADGLGYILPDRERQIIETGGLRIHPILAIVEAVVSLRKNRPDDCPIPESKLDELLELLLIMEMASTKVDSLEENFLFNQAILENMPINSRFFLPARSDSHSVALDVHREALNQYLVTIVNSGQGLREMHRELNGRHEYFVQYRLSSDQLKNANYFVNLKATTFSLYPLVGRVTHSPPRITDTIRGQKSGTCYVKSTYLLIKWFMREFDSSNQTYYWWKVWHLQHRAQHIRRFWSSTEAKSLSAFPLPANLKPPAEHSIASTILFLQTTKLFLLVPHMQTDHIKVSCIEMLNKIPMDSEWKQFLEAMVKSHARQ